MLDGTCIMKYFHLGRGRSVRSSTLCQVCPGNLNKRSAIRWKIPRCKAESTVCSPYLLFLDEIKKRECTTQDGALDRRW